MRHRGLAKHERTDEIHLEDPPKLLYGNLLEVLEQENARHVAEHIEAPMALDACSDGGATFTLVGDVTEAMLDSRALLRAQLRRLFESRFGDVDDAESGALARQSDCRRSPDAGGRAGHERHLAFESFHLSSS